MGQPVKALEPAPLWHVTLTAIGQGQPGAPRPPELEQMCVEHGPEASVRYEDGIVELQYWDEGVDCASVVDAAVGLWEHHRRRFQLDRWDVAGVEVLGRALYRFRAVPSPQPGVARWA